MIRALAFFLCVCTAAAQAQDVPFPAPASLSGRVETPAGSLRIATGPWTAGAGTPLRTIEGAVSQSAFRLAGSTLSTRDLIAPLRESLLAQGYVTLFECETAACGGFDFRYDLPILPEPAMHVDLGDFRYFAAIKQPRTGDAEAVIVIVSRAANAGFVQINRVGSAGAAPPPTLSTTSLPALTPSAAPVSSQPLAASGDIGTRLETEGSIALDDLIFPSGAAVLAQGQYASLTALAAYLSANPTRQIALVGHTDASGALDANIALSRRRAESVRRVLIDQLGIAETRVQAAGMGYLAPRATNLTDTGRAANRRVEVMLTNTE